MHLIDSLIGCYWLLALMGFDWLWLMDFSVWLTIVDFLMIAPFQIMKYQLIDGINLLYQLVGLI